jgi:hypothetical protein
VFIKVEPAGFFMYTVELVFDPERPDSEDSEVRDYLAKHELEPRYQWTAELEGRQCEWMQFGGCYLGKHLQNIGQIQRRAVEVELLTVEIEDHLTALSTAEASLTSLSKEQRQDAVAALAQEFHQDSSFQTNENGELTAVLDGNQVREAARRWLGKD